MKKNVRNMRFAAVTLAAIAVVAIVLSYSRAPQEVSAARSEGVLSAEFASSDDVTRAIRSADTRIFRVPVSGAEDRGRASQSGTIVSDHGSFLIVAAENSNGMKRAGLNAEEVPTTIHLPGRTFDPIRDPQQGTVEAASPMNKEGGYYIVQFGTTVDDSLYNSLTAAGVEILQYVPHQAYYVYAEGDAIARAAEHNRVRWVGRHMPDHKLPAFTAEQIQGARGNARAKSGPVQIEVTGRGAAIFDVAVFKRAGAEYLSDVLSAQFGGRVIHTSKLPGNFFDVIRVEMGLDVAAGMADIPGVFTIDPYIRPTREDERAAHIIAGNYTGTTIGTLSPPGYNPQTQFGVNGLNVTSSVVDDGVGIPGDGGFYVTAANTVNAPLRGATAGAQGHGHLQASIIAGTTPFSVLDPLGYNYGLGVAPASNIINIPFLRTGYTGTDQQAQSDTIGTTGPNGVAGSISNNSWGAGTNGNSYDSLAAQYDGFVRDVSTAASVDPMSIFFSAGNSGASGLTRPKVAKNVIATASSENLRSELDSGANNLDDISSFSSRGPAADGRVKPDITAPGQAVSGGRSGPDTLFGNIDTFHRWSSGTSHAVPNVTGAGVLFTQWWKSVNSGANPSPALLKAAILNTGREMAGVGATSPIPNGAEGWGRVFMRNMLNTGVPTLYINETNPLFNPGESFTYIGTVADTTKETRVTLVWTDPPGSGNPALVNNLDLNVTIGGNLYRGNVFSGGTSTTGGSSNTVDNVEQVWLPAGTPAGTTFIIQVNATALNGDGILGNADPTDQHFAVVGYNFQQGAGGPALIPDGGTLIAESCLPANGRIDPGETVTVSLAARNVGSANTVNDVGTLQATGGVTSPSGPQTYGVIVAGGPSVSRNFTFTADPNLACGSNLTATVRHDDGSTNLGNLTYTFPTGTLATAYSENFDSVTAPALPTGWIAANASGSAPLWTTSSSGVPAPPADSAPNAAFIDDPATLSDKRLDTPSFTPGNGSQLSFRNNFNMENTFDGGVLEISINGGPFTDIITAGGSFVSGAYTGTISTGFSSPIGGRSAWTGNSAGFITTTINLPAASAGQPTVLRFRMGSDTSVAGQGWRIDNLTISAPACCTAGGPSPTPSPSPSASPTPTPTPTPSPSATPTPSPTPSCTPSAQGFDDITTLPGGGWSLQNLSSPIGTTNWFQGNSAVFPSHTGAANSYIGANFNNTSGTGTISNWLITPVVTLANGQTMSFWTRGTTGNTFPDRLQVRMSTAGASTNVGSSATSVGDFTTLLLDINPTYSTGTYPEVWTQFTVTVSGLGGPTTGRFAFRYFVENGGPTGTNSNYIGIDTVQIDCPTGPSPTPTVSPTPTPSPSPSPSASPTPSPSPSPSPGLCNENFDQVVAPVLPTGWTATTTTGALAPWATTTNNPDTPLNAAFAGSVGSVSNTELVSPPFIVASGGSQMSFRNAFNLEVGTGTTGFDGMVLEISINGGPYVDIITAGGSWVTGGYNRTISTGFGSPIAGRDAWSGLSGGTNTAPAYITTTVNLPATANGQLVRMKWRVATDSSVVATGTPGGWVDTITGISCTATSAGVEITGRVLTSDGRGLRNATVTMTDANGVVRTATTSSFGFYRFEGVTVGESYVMGVSSRNYRFTPRVIQVFDSMTDVDFIGLE